MGTPIAPIVITPGVECTTCWGSSKKWALPTPYACQMQLHDWTEGSAWNEVYRDELSEPMTIVQPPGFPCQYSSLGDRFGWLWDLLPGQTLVIVALSPLGAVLAFRANVASICLNKMTNEITEPPNRVITGGYAELTLGAP